MFCLEEGDVKLAILNGKNPNTTKDISDEEIVKMKEWLAKKRLHSINYEADEISDYQRARAEFIEFMDNPINNYFQSEKFFDRLSITQLKKIPRLLERQTEYLTFTTEEKEYIKTFLLKEDLLVYLTRLLIGKFENAVNNNTETAKWTLTKFVDEMKLNTGLMKEEFFEAMQTRDEELASELLDQLTLEEIGLSKDEAEELLLEHDGYFSYDFMVKFYEKFGIVQFEELEININGRTFYTYDRGEVLDLSNNNLTTLREGMFDSLKELKKINLSFNDFGSLPKGIFDKCINLESIDLFHNKLTSLPRGIFDNLVNLKYLYIPSNELTSLPDGIFDKLVNLKDLNLFRNNLTSLPHDIFNNLVNLKELNMKHTNLISLPNGIFNNLVNLELLYIGINYLTFLPEGIFDNLENLRYLNISKNKLTSLPHNIFNKLVKLETIDITYNELTSLPKGIFDNLINLEILKSANNKLKSLPLGIFDNLGKLEIINLCNNDLKHLPDNIFDNLLQLQELLIENNKLTTLPNSIINLENLWKISYDNEKIDNNITTELYEFIQELY